MDMFDAFVLNADNKFLEIYRKFNKNLKKRKSPYRQTFFRHQSR